MSRACETEKEFTRHADRERGSATVELAIVLPIIVLAMLVLVGLGQALHIQLQCAEAVRVAARLLALGESEFSAQSYVAQIAGPTAQMHATTVGGGIVVEVQRQLIALGDMFVIKSQVLLPWEPHHG